MNIYIITDALLYSLAFMHNSKVICKIHGKLSVKWMQPVALEATRTVFL